MCINKRKTLVCAYVYTRICMHMHAGTIHMYQRSTDQEPYYHVLPIVRVQMNGRCVPAMSAEYAVQFMGLRLGLKERETAGEYMYMSKRIRVR